MKTSEAVEKIVTKGNLDANILMQENKITEFLDGIQKITNIEKSKGYTLPTTDTLRVGLSRKYSHQISDS